MSSVMFISRDLVEATAMTYGEFVDFMESSLEDVDPEAPGYLLQLSEEEFQWIPAEDFEESHMEVGDMEGLEPYQQRLLVERAIVTTNYKKLKRSFAPTTFLALPLATRDLLQAQERAMARYLEILIKRCDQFLH